MAIADDKRNADLAARARKAGLPEWQQEMAEAIGNDVLADIVADNQRPQRLKSVKEQVERGSGWIEPKVEDRSRDIETVDRIVEAMVGGPNDTSKLK